MPADPDKRELILQAALATFAVRGFHGTTVPEIAAAASVGAGTLYRYFESKEALGNALYRRWKQALGESLVEGLPIDAPPRAQFDHLVSRAFAFARAHPLELQFMETHHHLDYLDETSRHIGEETFLPALQFFEYHSHTGLLRALPVPLLTGLVWGGILGVLRAAWAEESELTPELEQATADGLWQAVLRPR
jgi:AcrR family transcriptional regulator